jgi:hypothetical protein
MEVPLVVRKSKRPAVLSFIMAVGVALAFFYWHPNLWSDRLAFGLACGSSFVAIVCLGLMVNQKPHLAITTQGIQALVWGDEEILWEDIAEVFIMTTPKADHLCLILCDSGVYRARKGRLAQLMMTAGREAGFGDLAITPMKLGLNASELMQLIRRQLAASRSKPARVPSAVKYRTDKPGNWI